MVARGGFGFKGNKGAVRGLWEMPKKLDLNPILVFALFRLWLG